MISTALTLLFFHTTIFTFENFSQQMEHMLWSDGCQTPAANFLRPRPSSKTLCHFNLRHIFEDSSPIFKGLQGQNTES